MATWPATSRATPPTGASSLPDPVAWPAELRPTSARFTLQTSSTIIPSQRNPFATISREEPAQGWKADLTFGLLRPTQKRLMQGTLALLDGPSRAVLLPDWDYDYDTDTRGLSGGAGGTILATGSKDAKSVALTGITGSNPAFKMGDRFQIDDAVYIVAADANHSSGNATVTQRPPLRAPYDDDQVTLTGIVFKMALTGDAQNALDLLASGDASVSLSFVEVF